MAPILDIQNLFKNYGTTEILKNINVSIEPGDFLVLVGPSGCGKSTLLNCIAGLEKINSGDILIDNRNMSDILPKFLFTFFIFKIDDISYPFTDPAVKPLMKYLPANT